MANKRERSGSSATDTGPAADGVTGVRDSSSTGTALSVSSRDKPDADSPPQRDGFGRFLPGAPSVNPAGRPPKGQAMTEILAKYLDMPAAALRQIDLEQIPAKDAIAVKQVLASLDDDLDAANRRYTFDRVDGRPSQAVIHSEDDSEQRMALATIARRLQDRYDSALAEAAADQEGGR